MGTQLSIEANAPRILMVASEFPPVRRNYTRTLKFAKFLAKLGCKVHVLTIPVSSMESVVESSLLDIPADIKITRATYPNPFRGKPQKNSANGAAPTKGNRHNSNAANGRILGAVPRLMQMSWGVMLNFVRTSIFIPDERMTWIPFAVSTAKKICRDEGIDIVYSSIPSYSNHLIARRVTKKCNLPWIADYRDPWTRGTGRIRYSRWRTLVESNLERRLLKSMDRIIVTTGGIGRALAKNESEEFLEKITVIHNGFDRDDFSAISPALRNDTFIISYTGVIYAGYKMHQFIDAVAMTIERNSRLRATLKINLVGNIDAGEESNIKSSIERHSLQNTVSINPPVSRREALAIQSNSHALLLAVNDDLASDGVITSKLFDYMAADRPVIALVKQDSLIARIVNKSHCGIVADIDDPTSIINAIESVYTNYGKLDENAGARLDYIQRFDRRVLTRKLYDEIVELLNKRKKMPG